MKTIIVSRKYQDEIYCVSLKIPETQYENFFISGKKYDKDTVGKYGYLIEHINGANELDIYKSNLNSYRLTSDDVKTIFPSSEFFYRYIGSDINGKNNRLIHIKDIFDKQKKDYDLEDIMEVLHVSKKDAKEYLFHYKQHGSSYLNGILDHLKIQWQEEIRQIMKKVNVLQEQSNHNIENYRIDVVESKKDEINIKELIRSLK